nr:MAG TPA: hypothetical protein [Caudoviricetes sp.]
MGISKHKKEGMNELIPKIIPSFPTDCYEQI